MRATPRSEKRCGPTPDRAQYRNTLRELLLLNEDVADILPPDAISRDGFVNNKETLQLSPLLLEAYFDIAEKALNRCIVDPKSKPTIQNFQVELGAGINSKPCPDHLILGADSLLLNNADFVVTQPKLTKPFDFVPFAMRTKYRFIEGYAGNDTVRGWRGYDSIYHAVYACMRGTHGYAKGRAYETVPQGLLLRPAIPSAEIFGVDSTYGPRANFKIALRELPDHGRFRVTVQAAKYNDGLLLDPGTAPQPSDGANAIVWCDAKKSEPFTLKQAGIYQVDAYLANKEKASELLLTLGDKQVAGTLKQPAFLVARLPAGCAGCKCSPCRRQAFGSLGIHAARGNARDCPAVRRIREAFAPVRRPHGVPPGLRQYARARWSSDKPSRMKSSLALCLKGRCGISPIRMSKRTMSTTLPASAKLACATSTSMAGTCPDC